MAWPSLSSVVNALGNQKPDAPPSFPFNEQQINNLKIVSSQLLGPVLAQVLSSGFLESFITRLKEDLTREISGLQHELAQTSNYNLTRIASLRASILKKTTAQTTLGYFEPQVEKLNDVLITLLKNSKNMEKCVVHPLSIKIFEFIKDELVKPEMSHYLLIIVTIMDKVLSLNSENNVTDNATLLPSLWPQTLPFQKMIIARITDDDIKLLFRDLIDPILCSADFWLITRTAIESFYVSSLQDYRNQCRGKAEEISGGDDDYFNCSVVTVPSHVFKENEFPGGALSDLVDDFFTFFINKKLLEGSNNDPIKKRLCDNLKQGSSAQSIFLVQLICLLLKINPSEELLVSSSSDESDHSGSDSEQSPVECLHGDALVSQQSLALAPDPMILKAVPEDTVLAVFHSPVHCDKSVCCVTKLNFNLIGWKKHFPYPVMGLNPFVMKLSCMALNFNVLLKMQKQTAHFLGNKRKKIALQPAVLPTVRTSERIPTTSTALVVYRPPLYTLSIAPPATTCVVNMAEARKYFFHIVAGDPVRMTLPLIMRAVTRFSEFASQCLFVARALPLLLRLQSFRDSTYVMETCVNLKKSKKLEEEPLPATPTGAIQPVDPPLPHCVEVVMGPFNDAHTKFMAALNKSICAVKDQSVDISSDTSPNLKRLFSNFCKKAKNLLDFNKNHVGGGQEGGGLFDEKTLFICNDIIKNESDYEKIIERGTIEQYIILYNRLNEVKNKSSDYILKQEARLNVCWFFKLFIDTKKINHNIVEAKSINSSIEQLVALVELLSSDVCTVEEKMQVAKSLSHIIVALGPDIPSYSIDTASGCLSFFQRKHTQACNNLKGEYETIVSEFKAVADQVQVASLAPAAAA